MPDAPAPLTDAPPVEGGDTALPMADAPSALDVGLDAPPALDGGADAPPPLASCELDRTESLGMMFNAPSFASDGVQTLVAWNAVLVGGSHMRLRGLTDGFMAETALLNRWFHAGPTWAVSVEGGVRIAADQDGVIQIQTYGPRGEPIGALRTFPVEGTQCSQASLYEGGADQLLVWGVRGASGACSLYSAVVTPTDIGAATQIGASYDSSVASTASGWHMAWATGRTIDSVRIEADGTVGAIVRTSPLSDTVRKVSVTDGLAAVALGGAIVIGPWSDASGVDAVATLPLSAPITGLQLVHGRAGYGLLWTTYASIRFVTLDEAGSPTSSVLSASPPDLVTMAGSVDIPSMLFEGPDGWWVSWEGGVGHIACP